MKKYGKTFFSDHQFGGVLSFIMLTLAIGSVFLYGLFSLGGKSEAPKMNQLETVLQLENAQPSNLSPDGELAEVFALGTKSTDLQRENKMTEIRGQVVQWTLPVYEVSRAGDRYKIQTLGNNTKIISNADGLLGAFVYITPKNEKDSQHIAALKTGDLVSIKGRISGVIIRNVVIDPAIIVYESLNSDVSRTSGKLQELPVFKVTIKKNAKTTKNILKTRYGSVEIINNEEDDENSKLLFRGMKINDGLGRISFIGLYSIRDKDVVLMDATYGNPRNGMDFSNFILLSIPPDGRAKLINESNFEIEDGSTATPEFSNEQLVMNLGFANGLMKKAVFNGETLSITKKKLRLNEVFPIPSNECENLLYIVNTYCTNLALCVVSEEGIDLPQYDLKKSHHPALKSEQFRGLCEDTCKKRQEVPLVNMRPRFCGIN